MPRKTVLSFKRRPRYVNVAAYKSIMPFHNIILIGFMGSGKTSIGKQLAKRLTYTYYDTDQLIVKKTGNSISQIIEIQGEKVFRKLESTVLESLLEKKRSMLKDHADSTEEQSVPKPTSMVLATGGGIILSPKNQILLGQLGTVVWLHASTDILFERAQRNSLRPLLEVEHPRHTFNTLLSTRLPIYQSLSDFKIDTTNLSYTQTLESIVNALNDTITGIRID